jgi:hypothetical protein
MTGSPWVGFFFARTSAMGAAWVPFAAHFGYIGITGSMYEDVR